MEWLFRPKVQLGLFVNFVFVMFTLVSSSAGGSAHVAAQRTLAEERRAFYEAPRPASAAGSANTPFRYLPLPPRVGPPQAVSDYDARAGQTSVQTKHDLTLVSAKGHRLSLSPSFYVSGKKMIPPHNVHLTFLSVGSGQFYEDECELEIRADGAIQHWAIMQVKHDYGAKAGLNATIEGMSQDIPYSVFVKLVASDRVTFKVGNEEITLSETQMGALRDMQRCIQDGTCE